LAVACAIADYLFGGRFLAWPDHATKQRVQDSVEDGGFSALVQPCDQYNAVGEDQGLFEFELLEIVRV